MARLRQLNPTLRVSSLKDALDPYQHPEDLARYTDGLWRTRLPNDYRSPCAKRQFLKTRMSVMGQM
jgi:hypothetical protein